MVASWPAMPSGRDVLKYPDYSSTLVCVVAKLQNYPVAAILVYLPLLTKC